MRNRRVHDALRTFAVDVSRLMSRALEEGTELRFEVVEEGDAGVPLYRYLPFTAEFVDERWDAVRDLESYRPALRGLGDGARPYLRHRGLPDEGADLALRDVMHRLFEDAPGFRLSDDRFERVHAELDATLAEPTALGAVIAPAHGVRIASPKVDLGDGLALVRRSAVRSPPSALEGAARATDRTSELEVGEPPDCVDSPLDVFLLLERDLPPDAPLPVDAARTRFRRTLTALRLCGAGGTALGPLAWARVDGGTWHPVALGVSARARPESWELRPAEEPELRELLEVLALSRHGPVVAWALDRFEMGCERELETEALSDYLLALRALLGEGGLGGADAELARRVAALCAPEADREAAAERIARAIELERRVVSGDAAPVGMLDSPRAPIREVEQSLRAMLRDVLCGYLGDDLREAAREAQGGGWSQQEPAEQHDDDPAEPPGDHLDGYTQELPRHHRRRARALVSVAGGS
jgi:hypothetical protein